MEVADIPQFPHSIRMDGFELTKPATHRHPTGDFTALPQRTLQPDQRLREHLEDLLAEADGQELTLVAALIAEELDAMKGPPATGTQ